MECVVTARRRRHTKGRQDSESTGLIRRVDPIENLFRASTEEKSSTPATIYPTSSPLEQLGEPQPVISKSPAFIHHHQLNGQVVESTAESELSPAALDGQDVEDECSSVYAAEAVCLCLEIVLLPFEYEQC